MTSASGKSYCTKCLLKKLYAWAELHYTGRFLSTESWRSFRAEKPRVKCLWPKPETPIFKPNIHYPASCVPILLLSRWPLTGPQADTAVGERVYPAPTQPQICMDLPRWWCSICQFSSDFTLTSWSIYRHQHSIALISPTANTGEHVSA